MAASSLRNNGSANYSAFVHLKIQPIDCYKSINKKHCLVRVASNGNFHTILEIASINPYISK